MRVEIDVVRKRDAMAVDGNWFPDLKIRRVTYYPDGTYFRHEYLSFLTGEWVAKDAAGIPRQCIYDDELRAVMNASEKEQRPRTVMATIIDGEHRYSGPIPRDLLETPEDDRLSDLMKDFEVRGVEGIDISKTAWRQLIKRVEVLENENFVLKG